MWGEQRVPHRCNRHSSKSARVVRHALAGCLAALLLAGLAGRVHAEDGNQPHKKQDNSASLRQLYEQIGRKTGLRWQQLAAIDQYERTLTRVRPKSRPVAPQALTGIYISETRWAGELNPDPHDTAPLSIAWFGGIGQDGDNDGRADPSSEADLLYTVASAIRAGEAGGTGEAGQTSAAVGDRYAIGLWRYYHSERAVLRVRQFAAIIDAFGSTRLRKHVFPLPVTAEYSYRSTWGDRRGWGGRRIHEGTDIFAPYGVPVRSTSCGIVELKGWNRYGGWRIGIRDIDNVYHYYAHLQGYDNKIKPGDVVQPGQVIGWVGSSGYGRPGTQGKFPPHLHYGVYRDRGTVEWAFDPYPLLRKWERDERKSQRAARPSAGR